MAKSRVSFLCRECGAVHGKWLGRCPDCGTWDSLERYVEAKGADESHSHAQLADTWGAPPESASGGMSSKASAGGSTGKATPLPEIEAADIARIATGIGELDRVLGGGLVPGGVVLLGGDPGIGKSTLLLQAAVSLAAGPGSASTPAAPKDDATATRRARRSAREKPRSGHRVLYVSSEESAYQTRLRAERVVGDGLEAGALDELFVLADTNLARIVEQARAIRPAVLVLDSIQMVYKADLDAAPGSVTQIRRCCTELVYLAKVAGMAIVLVGHVTKDGQLAGPKLLEHLVDAVLSFEGDRHHAHRVVRGIKNRFGTTLEVGLFEMTGAGLREVTDLGAGLDPEAPPRSGSIVAPVMHGTRCLLVELQALTAPGIPGASKRRTSGVDASRLAMLIAVLEQHGGLRLLDQDVFASAVGGLRVAEPAADLALALAVAGAHGRRAVPARTAVIGEVGLGGEIRPVTQPEPRLREAQRLGFRRVLAHPSTASAAGALRSLEVAGVSDIAAALSHLERPGAGPVATSSSGGQPVQEPSSSVEIFPPDSGARAGRI